MSPALAGFRRPAHLRAARRVLRRDGSDRFYNGYVVAVLGVLLGFPALGGIGNLLRAAPSAAWGVPMASLVTAAGWLTVALAVLAPATASLAVPSRAEHTYLVEAPFGLRPVVLPRCLAAVAQGVTGVGAVGAAVAWGCGLGPVRAAATVAGLAALGGLAMLALVIKEALTRWWHRLTWVLASLAMAALETRTPMPWSWVGALAFLVAGVLALPTLLDAVPIARVRRVVAARERLLLGVLMADARLWSTERAPHGIGVDWSRVPVPRAVLPRTMLLDALVMRRRPVATWVGAVLALAAGVLLGAAPRPLVAAVCLVACGGALRLAAQGLADAADAAGADQVSPEPLLARLLSHGVAPVLLVAASCGTGALVGGVLIGTAPPMSVLALVVAIAAATRFLLIGAAGLPSALITPVPTPMGDLSGLMPLLWLVRGILPALALLALSDTVGLVPACAVVLGATLLGAATNLRALHRASSTLPA